MTEQTDLRYPIGHFTAPAASNPSLRAEQIETLRQLPANLREVTAGLSDAQLDTPYRDGGWTVRQVVHHLADSHANAYIRYRLALTEDWPTVKPYDEAAWAELADCRKLPIEFPWPSSRECTRAGLRCLSPCRNRTSRKAITIPNTASKTLHGAGHVCLARPPPYRPHRQPARTAGLVRPPLDRR